jgi:hypothetical protein
MTDLDLLEHLKKNYGEVSGEKGQLIIFGSETGNADAVSRGF